MGQLEKFTEYPILPVYSQQNPNDPISFGQTEIAFEVDGTKCSDVAEVILRFSPSDALEFHCNLPTVSTPLIHKLFVESEQPRTIHLVQHGTSFEAFYTGSNFAKHGFSPRKSVVDVRVKSTEIIRAKFHLFNFPDFNGDDDFSLVTGEHPNHGFKRCGRAILKANGWQIVIAELDKTDELTKALKSGGGNAITHVGQISREDSTTFSTSDLDDCLTSLQYFLSFALARWVGMGLTVGVNPDGQTVCEHWGLPRIAEGAWNGSYSWFDLRSGEHLSQVYPGFIDLWNRTEWRTQLRNAIYWYLGATDRGVGIGVDTGLILAQTALEGLAWTYCVVDRKLVSEAAFSPRALNAADKLRLLVTSLGIPAQIRDITESRGR